MNAELHDDIVGFIYEAADAGGWRRALDAIAQALGLWGAHIAAVERSTGRVVCRHCSGSEPAGATQGSLRAFLPWDPAVAHFLDLPVGGWLHTHREPGDDGVVHSQCCQEFLPSHGGMHASVAKVAENATHSVLFAAIRGTGDLPVRPEEIAELDRLRAHIARATRRTPFWEPAGATVETAARVLDHFTYPMFLVDAHLRIRSRNVASDVSLAPEGYLEQRDGVLACRDNECDPVLARCVHALLGDGPGRAPGLAVRRFARIARADGSPIGLYAIALRPHSSEASAAEPLAMLVFHDPQVQKPIDPAIVAEMFGLSPAESKVAAILAMGRGPDEIAVAGGISVATVRAQIKAIFAKTGVSRQSELVALLRGMPGVSRPRPSGTSSVDGREDIERSGRPARRRSRNGSGSLWQSPSDL